MPFAYEAKKFIVINRSSGQVVYGHDDFDNVVERANTYKANSGSDHLVFSNIATISNVKIPTIESYKGAKE